MCYIRDSYIPSDDQIQAHIVTVALFMYEANHVDECDILLKGSDIILTCIEKSPVIKM